MALGQHLQPRTITCPKIYLPRYSYWRSQLGASDQVVPLLYAPEFEYSNQEEHLEETRKQDLREIHLSHRMNQIQQIHVNSR